MNCQQLRLHLPIYADAELDADGMRTVADHLATCGACQREVAHWQALRRSARRGLEICPVPGRLAERVRDRLASEQRAARLATYMRVSAFAAAAVILLAATLQLSGSWFAAPREDVGRITRIVAARQYADIFRFCAIKLRHDSEHAVRGADPALKTQELRRDLGFVFVVPDLTSQGFLLDGVCTCLQMPGAHTLHAFYRNQVQSLDVVSFFSTDKPCRLDGSHAESAPGPGDAPRPYEVASADDVNVVQWREHGMSFAMAGRLGVERLLGLAGTIDIGQLLGNTAQVNAGGLVSPVGPRPLARSVSIAPHALLATSLWP
ncbi:MAG: anti-sigma factor [Phycisphaerae bacterium]